MRKKDEEWTYTVTKEEYDAEIASGLTDDEVMKPGTYTAMRSRWAEKLKNSGKVKITIYLDGDVVDHFRHRAEQPNAAPYQTQINSELRKVMENGSTDSKLVERDILNDKKFLKALKKRLETV